MHKLFAPQGTPGEPEEEITIGVVGGDDIVRRAMTIARETGSAAWRLIAEVFVDETEALASASRIAPQVDVCLFGGPFPHDVAVERGDLPVPATFIPVGGSALYAALLRGVVQQTFDAERITIDSVQHDDVTSAYAEVDLSADDVLTMPYDSPASARRFFEFHQKSFQEGRSSGAVTSVPSIASALAGAGIPSLKMRPTVQTVRQALHTAALLGSGWRLEESRIVMTMVRVPERLVPSHAGASNYWFQDLKLTLQRALLQEARSMDAALLPRDEHSFLVVATMGSLAAATDGLTVAPFLRRVASEVNIDVEVGIGLGRSTREAEANARKAVDKAAAVGDRAAYLVGPQETVVHLPSAGRSDMATTAGRLRDEKAVATLRLLESRLDNARDQDVVVHAEQVADVLGVTLRTARRALNHLVDEGMAWPMPPARTNRAGRPPRLYQLLFEKLPSTTAGAAN